MAAVVCMSVPDTALDSQRLLRAALPAGLVVGVASTGLALLSAVPSGDPADLLGVSPLPVLLGVALATVTAVPFLVALLLVVTTPSRRVAAAGAGLVYAVDLVAVVASRTTLSPGPGLDLGVLAAALPRVVTVLAVATAVWLAYGGGYARLAGWTGDAVRHPLFAQLDGRQLGPGLTLRRGLLAAGVAGLVAAGGLVAVGGLHHLLSTVGRPATVESVTVSFSGPDSDAVGVSLTRLPARWLVEASVLLAVLFVAGPRRSALDLLKGLGLLVAVQSAVVLVPAFLPPVDPVFLLGARGPLAAALPDAMLLVGLAVGVRLLGRDESGPQVERATATADS
jgi:hypothetical protein